ncbi:hypothetical protein [Polymorphospora sp. NPDC050346]|uniref:hypothetical protein n=1 Tax=Polymorphospora sp. NPDC050346 TaxID=3155780 RepID=UPI0033C4EA09
MSLLVETSRSGQVRLSAPAGARRRPVYVTGLQVPCVSCAEAGRDKLGMPRDGRGSDPLCRSCWRSRTERQGTAERRRLVDALREDLVDAGAGCAACGEPSPVPECWLCGWSWLASLRDEFEAEVAAEAAAVERRFAAIAAASVAESRVDELVAWVQRLRAAVEGYAAGRSQGRAVELLADALARDAGERSTLRGRPGAFARVAGVAAVDADWRSGRRSLPGRERTAELAGCSTRAVTSAWARGEAVRWWVRTRQGRPLCLEERRELGRARDRAEFDIIALHLGDAASRAPYVAQALSVLDGLLSHALSLLATAQSDLDLTRARAGTWTDRLEVARRAELREAVATARQITRPAPLPAPIGTVNICSPHGVLNGEYLSSCLSRGLMYGPPVTPAPRPPRGGKSKVGASRSSTKGVRANRVCTGSQPLQRPRSLQGVEGTSQRGPRPSQWSEWAYRLASDLRKHWVWLSGVDLPWVAAVLGPRLGEYWTAEAVVDHVLDTRGGRPVMADPARPAAYLRQLLETALTSNRTPPAPARRHTEHLRQVAEAARKVAADRNQRLRDEFDRRDAAAATAAAGGGRAAALAIAAAAGRGDHAAARRAAADWPETPKPGSGLPPRRFS